MNLRPVKHGRCIYSGVTPKDPAHIIYWVAIASSSKIYFQRKSSCNIEILEDLGCLAFEFYSQNYQTCN